MSKAHRKVAVNFDLALFGQWNSYHAPVELVRYKWEMKYVSFVQICQVQLCLLSQYFSATAMHLYAPIFVP